MNAGARLLRRLGYLLRLGAADADLAEELAFHEAETQRAFESAGLDPAVASAARQRAMGHAGRMREESRAVWIWPWLESAMQDIAYAFRGLTHQPRFAIVAIATLGIAMGLNTSVLTAFNGVYFQSWAVSDPARVFEVSTIRDGRLRFSNFSLDEYRELASRARTVSGLAAMACSEGYYPGCDIWMGDATLRPAYVSASAFPLLGVPMERGRGFAPEQDIAGAPQAVAIISYDLWQRKLGGDPDVVGRRITLDGLSFTVVGVAGRAFAGTSLIRTDLWLPLASLPLLRKRDAAAHLGALQLVARAAPGVSREQVRSELDAITRGMREAEPLLERDRARRATRVQLSATTLDPNPAKRTMGYAMFGLLFLGSGLVVLLACANLANLHLARAAARGREIAVRVSLGASRARVLRQLLTESFVLAVAASAAGLGIACIAPTWLLHLVASDSLSMQPVPDLRIFGFAALAALVTCMAFGLTPALHASRSPTGDALKGRYGLAGANLSLRRMFLGAQVAVSVVVLSGAGLLMHGLARAGMQDFGFAVSGVSAITVELPGAEDSAGTAAFVRELLAGIATRADARSIGVATQVPFGDHNETIVLKPGQDSADARSIFTLGVSREYFDVLRIPLVAGRLFADGDAVRGAIVVNEAAAHRLWPGENAIGQSLTIRTPREVVGVVKDVDTENKAADEGSALPKIYEPFGGVGPTVVPRFVARGAAADLVPEITTLATRLAPAARVQERSLAERFNVRVDDSRQLALLVGILGVVALVLVSIGIFGVFAYVVQQRTREIGIRMALGAQRSDVVQMIVGSSARPIVIGLCVGLAGALAESRLLRRYLYGLSTVDPVTYGAIVLILAVAGLVAVYLPARRATSIVPSEALRGE